MYTWCKHNKKNIAKLWLILNENHEDVEKMTIIPREIRLGVLV
jgi:hypothetical protein